MTQKTTRVCGYCHTEKPWVWSEKKLKDGSKIYVDHNGRRWAGRRCPDCEKGRVQTAIRCDNFDKELIIGRLEAEGYEITSRSLPIRVKKDEKEYTIAIKRAYTQGEEVILESPLSDNPDELCALVFSSVRIFPKEKLTALASKLKVAGMGMSPKGASPSEGILL